MANRLSYILESNGRLSPHQHGFRRAHDTELALWNLINKASRALQNRRRMAVLSLDIKSAYDRVWHTGLVHKLGTMQIPPYLIGWIHSFLSDRTACVRVGSTSITRNLQRGVPQGSPLSPILFLIYIQDLLDSLHAVSGTHTQAYADDVISHWTISKGQSDEHTTREVEQRITTWAERWHMTFSPEKCKLLVIGRIRDTPLHFHLHGRELEQPSTLRYLGVWLDPTLSWKTHILKVTEKALKRLRMLQWGLKTTWGFHPLIARQMIDTTILPVLFYAASTWCTVVTSTSSLSPLTRVLRHCAKTSMGLLRTVSTDTALVVAGLRPAETYICQRLVEFYL